MAHTSLLIFCHSAIGRMEPETFRSVTQHLHHCATAVPMVVSRGEKIRPHKPILGKYTNTKQSVSYDSHVNCIHSKDEDFAWLLQRRKKKSLPFPGIEPRFSDGAVRCLGSTMKDLSGPQTRAQNAPICRPGYSSQLPLNCSEVNSKIHKPQCDCLFSLGAECGRCGKVEPKRKRKAQTRASLLSVLTSIKSVHTIQWDINEICVAD